jgi:acetate kinase
VAIPIDANNNDTYASTEILEAPLKNTPGPAGSFTAKINELTTQNLIFMIELEQWRSAALNAKLSNRELIVSLAVARLSANTLQQEIKRLKATCRRNTRAANFFRAKAMQSEAIMKEIFSATEAAKAKIPVIYSNS